MKEKNIQIQLKDSTKFLNKMLAGKMTYQKMELQMEQKGVSWFEKILQQKLMAFLANQLLKTNAQRIGESQRLAAQSTASSQGLAQQGSTLIKGITSDSAKTFSGVFSALSGIPYIGPELAAVAAPAAEAVVAGVSSKVVSAAGGYDVPSDTFARIHAREMVLPADLAEGVRAMTRGGSKTGGDMPNVHIHAADHADVMRMLINNRPVVTSAMMASQRDYATRHRQALRAQP